MKAKRILSIILVVSILIFTATSSAFAAPKVDEKGKTIPPGILKKMILDSDLSEEEVIEMIKENADNLPYGILKEIILEADLSDDAIEELYEEGFLDAIPSGILKNILSGDDEDDEDEDEDDDEVEVEGTITGIDVEDRVIEIDGEEYELPEEIEVEIDGEEAELEDLEVGMKVELEIEDDEAEIEAESVEKEETEVKGTITGIDVEDGIIEIDEEEYELADEFDITVDGQEATLEDLEVGMEVEVELNEDKAVEIEAESIEEEVVEIEGSITDIDLVGNYHLSIDGEEYDLSRDAQVTIGEEDATLEELEISMNATVLLLEDVVVEVRVEYVVEELQGSITGIDLLDRYIKVDEEDYPLASVVLIRVNDEDGTIVDLEVGMEIQAELVNGEIVEINGQSQSEIEVKGSIMAINIEEGYIVIGDNEYELAEDVEVKVDGEVATLEDLLLEMLVEAELFDGKIVKIDADVPITELVEGEITDIDLIGIYHLSIDGVKYDLLREALVKLNEENVSLEDLRVGMRTVVGMLNNVVVFIEATMVDSENIQGEITDLDLIGIYHITLGEEEYELSKEAEVTIDEEAMTLEDLEIGMVAEVQITDQVVTKISVETIIQIQGSITAIHSTGESIFIDEVEYNLADELEVIINEEVATLGDLSIGMTLVADMNEEEEVIRIIVEDIEEIEITEAQGSIWEINIEDSYISIDNVTYYLAEELELLILNGQEATLEDLKIGMNIEVELHDGVIAKIKADDKIEEFSGKIVEVAFTVNGMKLTIEKDTQEIVQYLVSENLEGNNNEVLKLGDYGQFKVINNIIVEATIEI